MFINKIRRIIKKDNRSFTDFERVYGIPKIFHLYKRIKSEKPDVVIVRGKIYLISIVSYLLLKVLKINTIMYIQRPQYQVRLNKRRKFFNFPVKMINKYIFPKVVITPIQGDANKGTNISPNCYYLPFVSSRVNGLKKNTNVDLKNEKVVFLSVGKYNERKRLKLLVEAFSRLENLNYCYLTIIGEKSSKDHEIYYEELSKLIKSHELCDKVTLKSNIDYSSMSSEYLKSDIFIMTSINEPIAVSILEAMSYSLPIICSDSNGGGDFIIDKSNGYIFKSDDVEDVTKYMFELSKNREKRMQFSQKSRHIVETRYSSEAYIERFKLIMQNEFSIKI